MTTKASSVVRCIGLDPDTLSQSIKTIETIGIGIKGYSAYPISNGPDGLLRPTDSPFVEAPEGAIFTDFLLADRRQLWWNMPLFGDFPEKVALTFEPTSCRNLLIKVNRQPVYVFAFRSIQPDSWPRTIRMIHWIGYDQLESLHVFQELERLRLQQGKTSSLSGLHSLERLERLDILLSDSLTNLEGLSNLPNLRTLVLNYCRGLTSLRGVGELHDLEELHLWSCQRLISLRGIEPLTKLRKLILQYCQALRSVAGIEHLKALETVEIGCTPIEDLRLIEQMENKVVVTQTS
jgi:hypothetical protein